MFYNNDDLFFYNLVSYCLKKNQKVKIFRFEEGYSSYIRPFCSLRAQYLFDKKHRNNPFKKLLCGMYYFYPDQILFQHSFHVENIERNLDLEVKKVIKNAFSITNNLEKNLDKKYIIFEESFFQDYGYNADVEFYRDIVKKIGSEKIMMKLHPRSRVNRFKDLGIEFLENSGVPWEAILLLNNFKDVRFITLASGSVINSRLMLGNSAESFLLYKCVTPAVPTLDNEFDKFVTNFKQTCGDNLYIPQSVEELYSIIEKYVEESRGL
ncbi:polysialyltransferase family glycosyltransferase [Mediterraneibacter gnavus]|uniref:polysialyltransferase family glycosyltransferase n=1 Tax=Mediterraneibacter gnavus TaxID=33038 RepID=UPI003B51F72F